MHTAGLRIGLLFLSLCTAGCPSHGGAMDGKDPGADLTAPSGLVDLGSGGSDDGPPGPIPDGAVPQDLTPGPKRCGDLACLPDGLVGMSFTASGTWRGSNNFQYACVPGTPGRDTNGCCTHTDAIGNQPSTIEFSIAKSPMPGGPLELRVQAVTLNDFGGRKATMQAGPQTSDTGFLIRPFALPTLLPYTIEGGLYATWTSPKMVLNFSGSGTGTVGGGRCSEQTTSITADWEALTP